MTDSTRRIMSLSTPRYFLSTLLTLVFFVGYYVIIIGISAILFGLAKFLVLDRDIPILAATNSHINLRPYLTVLPRPDSLSSLIGYRNTKRYSYGRYVHDLFGFVQSYERHMEESWLLDCTNHVSYVHHSRYSCKFPLDISNIGCHIGNHFGYASLDPCVLLHINKVLGWIPEFPGNSFNRSYRWGYPTIKIKCEGIGDFDKENIGRIHYYDEESILRRSPRNSLDYSIDYGQIRHYYFPYKKQRSYQNPFVWVKFYGTLRSVVIMVRCWATTKTIDEKPDTEDGYVKFELLID